MNTYYYQVLEVAPGASPGELKAAYRRLVKRYHPDIGGVWASGFKLREVIHAYKQVLSTPKVKEVKKTGPVRSTQTRPSPSYKTRTGNTGTGRTRAQHRSEHRAASFDSAFTPLFKKMMKYGTLLLGPNERAVRVNAAISLGESGLTGAYAYLRKALWDQDQQVVAAVVKAIGVLKIKQCDREIATLYLKSSPRMKTVILTALTRKSRLEDYKTLKSLVEQEGSLPPGM